MTNKESHYLSIETTCAHGRFVIKLTTSITNTETKGVLRKNANIYFCIDDPTPPTWNFLVRMGNWNP